jgi:hypothetical protein
MKREKIYKIFSNMPVLHTERLILRKMSASDTMDMFDYARREDLTKYLLWSPHNTSSYTRDYLKYIETPHMLGISNATNGIYTKWSSVSGASGYRVYRRGAGETTWTYLTTVKTPYYTDKSIKNNDSEYYRYTVRAVVDGIYSGYEDGIYIKRLSNPNIQSVTNKSNGVTITWNSVKGTTGYYIYRKTANSNWVCIGSVGGTNNTTFTDTTAVKDTTYTYTVRAVHGKTLSYFNDGKTIKHQ